MKNTLNTAVPVDPSGILEKPTNFRWVLVGVTFLLLLVAYFDRINIGVCGPMIMKEFGIDKVQLGVAMSAFFVAYVIMQIPGGMLSQKYGIRLVGTVAIVLWSVFTILTPLAWGFVSLVVIRFLFGLGEGPLMPNSATFIARWINKKEKGLASGISMLSGAFLGSVIAPPLAVWILTVWNWHAVFYVYGAGGVIVGLLWYTLSRDYPHVHPSVNKAELAIITGESLDKIKETPKSEPAPWKKFLRSGQFWAVGLQIFSVSYIMYLFLSWLPIYLLEARGLNLKAMGFAVSYPWLAIFITVILGGKISDALLAKGYSKFIARSLPAIIGLAVSGVSFYAAGNVTSANESILWLTVSLGALGFTYTSGYTSCQDLGGKFGGTVVSWMQTWSNIGGILAPIITPMLVKVFGWQQSLLITSFVVILGFVLWFFVKPDEALV